MSIPVDGVVTSRVVPGVVTPRVVITGRGVVSAIGTSAQAFGTSLRQSEGGIGCYPDLMPGQIVHVGLVSAFVPPAGLALVAPNGCDRTAQMAATAAVEALTEAGLWDGDGLRMPGRDIGLMLGSSHGGRSQIDRFVEGRMDTSDPASAHGVMELGAHYHQTAVVAAVLGVHGPALTFSTACSSSGTAIAHGVDLLRGSRIRAVVAGGADGFSKLTLAGFRALGAVADGPCGPFGSRVGISLGEGAAFVVLERLEDALARGAEPLAEVFACATTWDAHHLTAPEPSGDGMRRAIEAALETAGLPAEAIDYVNAHGTGTRANDIAETLALKRVFLSGPPPVSATKSFTGHTLGASSATGLLAGIAGAREGWLAPTLAHEGPRPGCDLDYVANAARPAETVRFLALSAAFGGCNCAIVAGKVGPSSLALPLPALDQVVITGLGVMSPLGCDPQAAFVAAVGPAEAWAADARVARVRGFDAKRHLPRGRSSRMNAITQFAVAAIEQALMGAGWPSARRRPTKIGLMVGLSRGAAGSFQTCMESVLGGEWGKVSPTAFPHLVMSSVGGQASVAVGLKGAASTMVGEGEIGIALLGQASGFLAQRADLDALVVLAADEIAPVFQAMSETAYGPPPLPRAEGAVALVLERRAAAVGRGATILSEVAGYAQTFDAAAGPLGADADGVWLEDAVRSALAQAGEAPDAVGLTLVLARGEPASDQREALTLKRVFGNAGPAVGALSGHAGWAEASGGLLSVAMAVIALQNGQVPGQIVGSDQAREFHSALVAGSSRHGSNAAVLLRQPDRAGA